MKRDRISFYSNEASKKQDIYLNINTTPLIDVLLVLIIMIIITMPIQLHKLDLNLGEGTEISFKNEKKIVVINLHNDESVSVDGKLVGKSREDIRNSFASLYDDYQEAILELNVDSNTKYSSVLRVLSEATTVGFKSVGLPETNKEKN